MKQTVTESVFVDSFDTYGRSNNFSRAARRALFEYLKEMEKDCGEELELDPIAVCCDWSEYSSGIDWAGDYGHDLDEEQDEADQEEEAMEYLRDNTQVIEFDGGIVVAAF